MNSFSTRELNKLRSQGRKSANRVEEFVESYILEDSHPEEETDRALQDIINTANELIALVSKMKEQASQISAKAVR